MAHKCPRCEGPVKRGSSRGAQIAAGLVGVMFQAAFGAFTCEKCGKIARSEFPDEVRRKMAGGTVLLVVGAVALASTAIWIISTM